MSSLKTKSKKVKKKVKIKIKKYDENKMYKQFILDLYKGSFGTVSKLTVSRNHLGQIEFEIED